MEEKIKITKEGLEKLQKEYDYLVKVKREEIKKDLEYARSLGDLSENADYDAARNNQRENEQKISELRKKLDNYELIGENLDKDVIGLNNEVTFINERTNETRTITLLGDEDADPFKNIISVESALGKAILNKRVGDRVTVDCPNKYDVTIVKID